MWLKSRYTRRARVPQRFGRINEMPRITQRGSALSRYNVKLTRPGPHNDFGYASFLAVFETIREMHLLLYTYDAAAGTRAAELYFSLSSTRYAVLFADKCRSPAARYYRREEFPKFFFFLFLSYEHCRRVLT